MKKRWLFWLLIVAFAVVVVTHRSDVARLLTTLVQGQWQWVLAAILLQAGRHWLLAVLYWSAFDIVSVKSRVGELLPVVLSSLFVNAAASIAGGIALFVDDAARRGESASRASAGTLLLIVVDYCVFTALLVGSLIYLAVQHDLKTYELATSALLLLLLAGLAAILVLGLWQPARLSRLFAWAQRLANRLAARFHRPTRLPDDWAARNAAEFSAAAAAITTSPLRLVRTLIVAVAMWLLNLASLYVLFQAFYQPVGIGVLVAGFALGTLFLTIAVTPQGVGVVEGVMTVIFVSRGVPATQAAAVVLAFRGLSLWLPTAVGFLLMRNIKLFGTSKRGGTPRGGTPPPTSIGEPENNAC